MHTIRRMRLLCAMVLLSLPLFSQTAQKIEALLDEQELSWANALVFLMEAAEFSTTAAATAAAPETLEEFDTAETEAAPETAEATEAALFDDPEKAFQFALDNKWLPKNAAPDDTARLDGVALIFMRSFKLKGGIFYGIGKSPHHAYREMVFKDLIRGNTDPGMSVSGQDLLLMTSRLFAMQDAAVEKKAAAEQKKADKLEKAAQKKAPRQETEEQDETDQQEEAA